MIDQSFDSKVPYFFRFFYDLLFFILVNVIVMNIVFGIIIDAFAGKKYFKPSNRSNLLSSSRSEKQNSQGQAQYLLHLWAVQTNVRQPERIRVSRGDRAQYLELHVLHLQHALQEEIQPQRPRGVHSEEHV